MKNSKKDAYLNARGEGEAYWAVGAKATIKGPGILEFENPGGWEIPLHVHDNEDEVHYYLGGAVTVTVGDKTLHGTPGSLAFLPRGVPHALRFEESGGAGRWLWISPVDRSDLAREVGVPVSQPEPSEDEIDMERVMAIFEKNGMRFLDEGGH
jgi:quercetin dioxygenase-like cupin family protein